MDLGRYIFQVLKHRNEVYVKGLGVFKRIHTSSVYDEQKAVYLPPLTYLEFDSKAVDGVDLADYIQQANQVSRTDAEALVQEAVLNLFDQIRDHGQASLHHLGHLIRHGNSLVFKAEDLSGFQLQPVDGGEVRPTVEEEVVAQQEEEPIQPEEVIVPPVETEPIVELTEEESPVVEEASVPETPQTDDVAPVMGNPEEENNAETSSTEQVEPYYFEEEPVKSSKAIWYIAAALIGLLIVGALYYFNRPEQGEVLDLTKDKNNQQTLPLDSNQVKIDSIAANDSTLKKQDSIPAADTVAKAPAKKLLIPEGHHYYIIIGKHSTLAKAYEQAEAFNKDGIPSVRVIPSKLAKNKKTVIWDSYPTKAQADSANAIVQKRYVSDAWVQKIN
ncbi:hypothetical protein ACP6L2_15660 [Sphingobacterium lactis]|uniref:hypothetical protein n=1 Tax=Sphingobacterium lactis TaxID=797291 RepID=UPI003F7DB2F5